MLFPSPEMAHTDPASAFSSAGTTAITATPQSSGQVMLGVTPLNGPNVALVQPSMNSDGAPGVPQPQAIKSSARDCTLSRILERIMKGSSSNERAAERSEDGHL